MKTDDPWFRATEIQYGPDGGIYILDWCDIGECHEQDGVHRTSGRIYKITYGDPVKPKETDLTQLGDEELVKLQWSDNEWLVRMARWELRERAWKHTLKASAVRDLSAMLTGSSQPARQLRALWAVLFIETSADSSALSSLPSSQDEYVKAWKMRLQLLDAAPSALAAAYRAGSKAVADLRVAASAEKSAYARLLWSEALQRLPDEARASLAAGLLSHPEDITDHNLPLMDWYGIRDLPPAELAKLVDGCRIPLVRHFIARRVTEEIEKDPAPLNTLLSLAAKSKAEGLPADILDGMNDALKGWRKTNKPAAWDAFAASLAKAGDPAIQKSVRDLNVLFGDGRALDEVRVIALDTNADLEARRSALRTLVEAKAPDRRAICEKLLGEHSLGLDAVQGLSTFDDPAIAEQIIKKWRSFYGNEHNAVVAALASRPSFAKVLLAHIGAGADQIARKEITPVIARQIRSFNDEALTKKLTEVWGEQRESSGDKLKLIAALKEKLTPGAIAKADPAQGRLLFTQTCAVCHRLYGEGNDIGPDLTGSGRHDINYLLENIVDPSAIVAADFKMSVVTLKDGRVLNGIIYGQSDHTLTVKMIGQEVTVEKSEITKQEQLPISMMPEGLLLALGDEQTRNLIAYLMSNGQVPLPSVK
jgi:putative heme-binding domain-containing protein